MSIRYLALIVFVGLTWLPLLQAKEDSPRQFDVFFEPGLIQLKPQDATVDAPGTYPLYPNRFTDYLPGNLFDMRRHFEAVGARFRPGDFAWFNPDRNVLIVGASPDDLRFIRSYILGVNYDPPQNIILSGRITIGANPSHKGHSVGQLSWQIYGRNGQRSSASAKVNSGIACECEIEPVTKPDGASFEYNILLQANYEGAEYKLTASAAGLFGKEQTMLLGTTPKGERVEFHLEAKPVWVIPKSPLEDAKWKAGLLKRLKSTLH